MATTISRSTITDDDGTGTVGTVLDAASLGTIVYDKVDALLSSTGITLAGSITEHDRAVPMGQWAATTYNSSGYHGSTGLVWTVESSDVITSKYTRIGQTIIVQIAVINSQTSGAGSPNLVYDLPGSMKASGVFTGPLTYTDAGSYGSGWYYISAGSSQVLMRTANTSNWSTGTSGISIYAQFIIGTTSTA